MITLTKPEERQLVSLDKGPVAPRCLTVRAMWQSSGDASGKNTDLDLRIGILLPDGRMKLVYAPRQPGSFDHEPWVLHTGDVTAGTAQAPGTEIAEVNPAIARLSGGRVALVFSLYSAVSNGVVPVASLRPRMRMEYGAQVVECDFDFSKSDTGKNKAIYTYVIGIAVIDKDRVSLQPSGVTSLPDSEKTPWMTWDSTDGVRLSMDGPAVMKGFASAMAKFVNVTNPRRYS